MKIIVKREGVWLATTQNHANVQHPKDRIVLEHQKNVGWVRLGWGR